MKPITYVEDVPPAIARRVRARYADQVHAMEQLGFHELCCYSELLGDYSLLLQPRQRDLHADEAAKCCIAARVCRRLRRSSCSATRMPETIALPMGMGVKLYSGFADGTLVITANFVSTAVPRANSGVRKQAEVMSIPRAWQRHQERVATFTGRTAPC